MHTNLDELIDRLQTNQMDNLDKIAVRLSSARRALKSALGFGQVQKAQKSAGEILILLEQERSLLQQVLSDLQSFAFDKYLDNQFDAAFKEGCRTTGIALQGSFPRYTIVPIVVNVLADAHHVEVNGREMELGKVDALIGAIRDELEGLEKNSISPNEFLPRIVQAYNRAVEESIGHKPSDRDDLEIPIKSIYDQLIPKKTDRLKYSLRNFSYDIFRLQSEGLRPLDGRKIIFKAGRDTSNAVRISLPNGREVYYSSISLTKQDIETADGA